MIKQNRRKIMYKVRNLIIVSALVSLILFPTLGEAHTRIYVRFGPPALKTVKVVRPAKPYPNAVWISGYWAYRNGHYVWVKGYWVKPRPHYVFVRAHWQKTRYGWYFVPGHWVKK